MAVCTGSDGEAPSQQTSTFTPYVLNTEVVNASVGSPCAGFFRGVGTDVVVSRETSIELLSVSSYGRLSSISVQAVYANVLHLRTFPCKNEAPDGRDLLLLFTDTGNLSVLLFSSALNRFVALQQRALAAPGLGLQSLGHVLAVAPGGEAVAVGACQDTIALLPCVLPACAHERAALLQDAANQLAPPNIPVLASRPAMYLASGAGASRASAAGSSPTPTCPTATTATCTVWSLAFVAQQQAQYAQGRSSSPVPGMGTGTVGMEHIDQLPVPSTSSGSSGSSSSSSSEAEGRSACGVLHLAAILHRRGRGDSEVVVLRYCPASCPLTLTPLASVLLSHAGVLGIPTALAPVPSHASGLVVVGTSSVLLLDVAALLDHAASRMRVRAQHNPLLAAQSTATAHPLVTCSLAHLGPEPKEAAEEVARLLATHPFGSSPRPSHALSQPSWLHPLVGPGSEPAPAGVKGGSPKSASPATCEAATGPVVTYQPLRWASGEPGGLARTSVDRSGGSSVRGGVEAGAALLGTSGGGGDAMVMDEQGGLAGGRGSGRGVGMAAGEEEGRMQQHVAMTTAWLPACGSSTGGTGVEPGPDVLLVATSTGKMVACAVTASRQQPREGWGSGAAQGLYTPFTSTASGTSALAGAGASQTQLHLQCVALIRPPAGGLRPASDMLGLPGGTGVLYCEEQGDMCVLGVPGGSPGGLWAACAAACAANVSTASAAPAAQVLPPPQSTGAATARLSTCFERPSATGPRGLHLPSPAAPGLLGLLSSWPGSTAAAMAPASGFVSAPAACTTAEAVPLVLLSCRRQAAPTADCAVGDLAGEGKPQMYSLTCQVQTDGQLPTANEPRPEVMSSSNSGQRLALGGIDVLRTGVGTHPVAHWPAGTLPAATGLWPMPLTHTHTHHSLLVASFLGGSRALTLGTHMTDATELLGLASHEPTVAVGFVQEGLMAQVTPSAVLLCCMEGVLVPEAAGAGAAGRGDGPAKMDVAKHSFTSGGVRASRLSVDGAGPSSGTDTMRGAGPAGSAGTHGSSCGAAGAGAATGSGVRGGTLAWRSPKNSRHGEGVSGGHVGRGSEWGLQLAPRARSWSGVVTDEVEGVEKGRQKGTGNADAGALPAWAGAPASGQSAGGLRSMGQAAAPAPVPQGASVYLQGPPVASNSPAAPPRGLPRSGGSRPGGTGRRLSAQPAQQPHAISSPGLVAGHGGRVRRHSARTSPGAGCGMQDAGASPVRAALRELHVGGSSSNSEAAGCSMDVDGETGAAVSSGGQLQPAWAWGKDVTALTAPGDVGVTSLALQDEPMQLSVGVDAGVTTPCTSQAAPQPHGSPAHKHDSPETHGTHPCLSSLQDAPDSAPVVAADADEPGIWRAASAPVYHPQQAGTDAAGSHASPPLEAPATSPSGGTFCGQVAPHILTAAIAPGCIVTALSRASALHVLAVVSKAGGGVGGAGGPALRGRKRGRALWHVQHAGFVPVSDEVSCLQLQPAPLSMLPLGLPCGSQPYWLLVGDRTPAVTLHLLVLGPQGMLLHHTALSRSMLPSRIQTAWDAASVGGGPVLPAVPQSLLICPSPEGATASCPTFVTGGTATATTASCRTTPGPSSASTSFTTPSPTITVQWLVGYRQGSAALYQADVRGGSALGLQPLLMRAGVAGQLGAGCVGQSDASQLASAQLLWHSKLGQQPVDLCPLSTAAGVGHLTPAGAGVGAAAGCTTGAGGTVAAGGSGAVGRLVWPPVLAVSSTTALLQLSPFNSHVAWRTVGGLRDVAHACSLLLPPSATSALRRSSSCEASGCRLDSSSSMDIDQAGTSVRELRPRDTESSGGGESTTGISTTGLPFVLTVQQDASWTISAVSLGPGLPLGAPLASVSHLFPHPAAVAAAGSKPRAAAPQTHGHVFAVGPHLNASTAAAGGAVAAVGPGPLKHVHVHPSGCLVMLASPAQPQPQLTSLEQGTCHRVVALRPDSGECVASLVLPSPELGTCLALWSAMAKADELVPQARRQRGARTDAAAPELAGLATSGVGVSGMGGVQGPAGGRVRAVPTHPLPDDALQAEEDEEVVEEDQGPGSSGTAGGEGARPAGTQRSAQDAGEGMVWEGEGERQGEAGTSASAHAGPGSGLAAGTSPMDESGGEGTVREDGEGSGVEAGACEPRGTETATERACGRAASDTQGAPLNVPLVLVGTSLQGAADAGSSQPPANQVRGQLHLLRLASPRDSHTSRAAGGCGPGTSTPAVSSLMKGGGTYRWDVLHTVQLPDAVGAVCGVRPRVVVASVGKRLVAFHLKAGRLVKFGWIGTRNMATHLASCGVSDVIAAADGICTITLYKYREESGEGIRPLQVIAADTAPRPVTSLTLLPPSLGVASGGAAYSGSTLVACDAGGAVSMLQVEAKPLPPMLNLEAVGTFNMADVGTRIHAGRVEQDRVVGLPLWASAPAAPTAASTLLLPAAEGAASSHLPVPALPCVRQAVPAVAATSALLPAAQHKPQAGWGTAVSAVPSLLAGLGSQLLGPHAGHMMPRTRLRISGLSGAVYSLVATPGGAVSQLLPALESILASLPATAPVSGARHSRFRGTAHLQHLQLHSPPDAVGVVDGDLLAAYLQLPRTLQEQVVAQLWEGPHGAAAAAVLGPLDAHARPADMVTDVVQLVEWALACC